MSHAPALQSTKAPLPNTGHEPSHEPIHHPAPLELDTTTPMVREGAVSRFTNVDVQRYGPWLIPKLTSRWPQISAMTFSGWVMGWTNGNGFLFIKTENAVGLAEVFKQTPELRIKAREVFVFCNGKEHEEEALQIYREFKRWGRSLGVAAIGDIGTASDLTATKLRVSANAKTDPRMMLEL